MKFSLFTIFIGKISSLSEFFFSSCYNIKECNFRADLLLPYPQEKTHMSSIKRIALASAVGMLLLSSVSFAAVSGEMQNAANAQAQAITKAVNISKATIQCKQATLRIASAAKAKGGKLKGAELRSAVMEATSTAAIKFDIEEGCVTPVYVANAASRLTGIYATKGPIMGLAKAGAAATAPASGGMGSGIGILAGLVGLAAIAASISK